MSSQPSETVSTFDYGRYLNAKVTVDDRALNRGVLARLRRELPEGEPRLLEIGAGLGTMVARLVDWGVITGGEYTLLDADGKLLTEARAWLADWAARRGLTSDHAEADHAEADHAEADHAEARAGVDALWIGPLCVRFVEAELGAYLEHDHGHRADVLIAHAVLDVVDVADLLPKLVRLLAPGGLCWFTINYDGETIFVPDHPLDAMIMSAYQQDMDERVRYGRPAGESRTGRHLFGHLRAEGAAVLAAGSSDWVVHAAPGGGYPFDEAHFVDCILRTIRAALRDRVDRAQLSSWCADRERQLRSGELVYIAHQLDLLARVPADPWRTRPSEGGASGEPQGQSGWPSATAMTLSSACARPAWPPW